VTEAHLENILEPSDAFLHTERSPPASETHNHVIRVCVCVCVSVADGLSGDLLYLDQIRTHTCGAARTEPETHLIIHNLFI